MLNQTPKGKVSKEENKRETEEWGRVVRCQNRNLQQTGILSPDSKTPENQNMKAFFLCQSDKARVRSPVTDFPCPWFCLSIQGYQTTGNNSPPPRREAEGASMGATFCLVRKIPAVPQQGSLLDQGHLPVDSGHVLIFCLWPWHHLGVPFPHQFSHTIFLLLFKYFHYY